MNKPSDFVSSTEHPQDFSLATLEAIYIQAATSDNTRRAYQSDIRHFLKEGGELPATPEIIQQYLNQCAAHYNPRTLVRHLTSIRQWHQLSKLDDPVDHPLVSKTMRGILRIHGKPKRQAAAMRLVGLDKIIDYLDDKASLIDKTNKALIVVGYFGAFRRSELVSLNWSDVRFVNDGMVIQLARSKTDQEGQGAQCVIPFGDDKRCPVRAMIDWRSACKQNSEAIFRRVSAQGALSSQGISAGQFNRIVQSIALQADVVQADQMSAHSLRRGFATEASRLGASLPAIKRHGRWRSTKTVVEYIEAGRHFKDSAVNVLFDFSG